MRPTKGSSPRAGRPTEYKKHRHMEPEELQRILNANLGVYTRHLNAVANSNYELDDLFDPVDYPGLLKSKSKPKKAFELLNADSNELDLIGLTMEKAAKGLKPYIINIKYNVFGELGNVKYDVNEKSTKLVWLLPKIAERIQERFDSISAIEKEIDEFTRSSYRKIEEYEDRIKQILDTGHDHIL